MNREEALKVFVRERLKELTDRNATKLEVKLLRKSFFERHHLSAASRFSNYDVAQYVVKEILKAKKDQPIDNIKKIINGIPFIRDEIKESSLDTLIATSQLGASPNLTADDLRKMHQEEYLTGIEAKLLAKAEDRIRSEFEAEKERLSKMKAELDEEKKSLDTLKSALDNLPPDFDMESHVNDEITHEDVPPVLWWKELGLEGNPFSSNQGLFGIPKAKYDDVVVQTPFVKSFVEKADSEPSELLGKTIVVLGEFGSGKTTIFQLIAYRSGIASKITPILTSVNPEPSVAKLTHQVISQIYEKLPHHIDVSTSQPIDEIGICIRIMAAAMKSMNVKGFLLFVDGLHKSETYQKQSLEFLQQLQNFQERVAHHGLACGILVAGSLAWEQELTTDPSLSGSYYKIEKIPVLSEESAIEAVVRRIYSFVPPGIPQPTITKENLREAFRVLSGRLLHPPTFRDYLDHVRDRFVAREYANLGISIPLHLETIESIKQEISQSPLAAAYQKLSNPKDSSPRFRKALRVVLLQAYKTKGIAESSPIFHNNTGAFFALKREGFIVRGRFEGRINWRVSSEMLSFLQNLYGKYKILPRDVLEMLFTDPVQMGPREAETIYGSVKKNISTMVTSWRSGWPEVSQLLERVKGSITRIEKASEYPKGTPDPKILDDLGGSIRNLLRAIMYVAGDKKVQDFDFERFAKSWYAPENTDTFYMILNRPALPKNITECFGIFHQHAQVLGELCGLLSDLVRGEGVARLTDVLLTRTEFSSFHEVRTMFLNQQYKEVVDKVSEIIDSKIKDVAYIALLCAFGPKLLSMLPNDIKEKLKGELRGHPRAKRPLDQNFFYDLSRSEYSKIVFNTQCKNIFFGDLTPGWEYDRMKDSMGLLFSLADRESHKDRPSYFRDHSTEIADVLKNAPRLCELFNKVMTRLLMGPEFTSSRIKEGEAEHLEFGFGSKAVSFCTHRLNGQQVEEILFKLLEKLEDGPQTIPPLEEWLTTVFPINPTSVIGILRVSIKQDLIKIERVSESFGFSISLTEKGEQRLKMLRPRFQRIP